MKPLRWALILLCLAACAAPSPDSPSAPATTTEAPLVQVYALSGPPDPDTFRFKTVDGREFTPADFQTGQPFPSKQVQGDSLTLAVTLGDQLIEAKQLDAENEILVTRNAQEIFRTASGGISPIPPLQNLWAYDDHWALEINFFQDDAPFNGQVFVDGVSIGEQHGYQEVFNFQTLHGRPFYFFRQQDKVNAWFDGQTLLLGYDEVPHYLCCADSWLNPKAFPEAVLFFATQADTWYFVRIEAPP